MAQVGTFRKYSDKQLGAKKMALIKMVLPIIHSYESRNYAMTLRQLYYQTVARGLLENIKENYDSLGDAVSDGRMCGLISWTAIEDRVRFLRGLGDWENPREAFKDARKNYRLDWWENQPVRPEIWVEKDALLGVLQPVCDKFGVNYFSCKGYGSQSELWQAGQRFARYIQKGQRPIVFHLGDHDPSGVDMTRDNRERLSLFAGVPIQVVRLALNMDQIQQYKPPPNYVKPKDARTANYIETFGVETCWELDALPPDVLHQLVEDAVLKVRDEGLFRETMAREAQDKNFMDVVLEESFP